MSQPVGTLNWAKVWERRVCSARPNRTERVPLDAGKAHGDVIKH